MGLLLAENFLGCFVEFDRVVRFEYAQAFGQFVEAGREALALFGKNNLVVAFVGFDDKQFFVERITNSGDIAAVTRVFGAQVDHENAVLTQCAITGVVEGLAAELVRLSVFVKAID